MYSGMRKNELWAFVTNPFEHKFILKCSKGLIFRNPLKPQDLFRISWKPQKNLKIVFTCVGEINLSFGFYFIRSFLLYKKDKKIIKSFRQLDTVWQIVQVVLSFENKFVTCYVYKDCINYKLNVKKIHVSVFIYTKVRLWTSHKSF